MHFRFAAASLRGMNREVNWNAACGTATLLAVADGLGTDGAGPVIGALEDFAKRSALPPANAAGNASVEDFAREAMECAHRALVAESMDRGEPQRACVTALACSSEGLCVAHIGDTRAYMLRGRDLFQITNDDVLTFCTREPPPGPPKRGVVCRYLDSESLDEESRPYFKVRSCKPGDRYMLCTPGLALAVSGEEIWHAMLDNPIPDGAVDVLMEAGRRSECTYSMTCVIADLIEDDDVPAPVRVGMAAGSRR